MLQFEWDETKNRKNKAKHGVFFSEATLVFNDPVMLVRYDDRFDYGEDRFVVIGRSGAGILTVVYAERADRVRIISAWRSTRDESDAYFTNAR